MSENEFEKFSKLYAQLDVDLKAYNERKAAMLAGEPPKGYAMTGLGIAPSVDMYIRHEKEWRMLGHTLVLLACTPLVLMASFALGFGPLLGLAYMPLVAAVFLSRLNRPPTPSSSSLQP